MLALQSQLTNTAARWGAPRHFFRVLAASAGLLASMASVVAQQEVQTRSEYHVKAVSLCAFGRYIRWPDSAFEKGDSPFVIGTFGGNPFGDALERIAKEKTLNGRTIRVLQIEEPAASVVCHIVFVSRSVTPALESKLFEHLSGRPVLLVGESPGFASRGGIINFYQSGASVRFELNPDKSVENKLRLNAKLLALGTRTSTQR